tara:strand:- start:159 stop:275 length:117 start_codon:yes stop_codon:yes gene_type:complete
VLQADLLFNTGDTNVMAEKNPFFTTVQQSVADVGERLS